MATNMMAVLGVNADEEKMYRHFLRHPETPVEDIDLLLGIPRAAVGARIGRLCELGLLRRSGDEQYTAADPEVSVARLADQRLSELHSELQQVTGARAIADSLSAEQTVCETSSGRMVETVTRLPEVRARIEDLAFFAREEVLSVEPHEALSEENIAHARPLDLRCLRRGVRVRNVVPAKTLEHGPSAAYLSELQAHGAQIRVADHLAERILVYDGRTAVVPMDPDDTARGALLARESGLVAHIVALFERIWDQATPLTTAESAADPPAISTVEKQVLEAMCSGDKDEVGARAIGVSVRTYRRHVAELMQLLDATSRAQTALLARERGWV